jgi:hypothetical protein
MTIIQKAQKNSCGKPPLGFFVLRTLVQVPVLFAPRRSVLPLGTVEYENTLAVLLGWRIVENLIEAHTLKVTIGASHADSEEMVTADGLFEER